jgi:hypothetical protein
MIVPQFQHLQPAINRDWRGEGLADLDGALRNPHQSRASTPGQIRIGTLAAQDLIHPDDQL